MKTFIEIMKWVGCGLAVFGFVFATGMFIADTLYRKALGYDAYYELNAVNIWDILGVFVMGCALASIAVILEAIFEAGKRSALGKEEQNG